MALIIEQLRDQLCLSTNSTDVSCLCWWTIFLQTVQMVIISVDEQFSAKSTDVAISCQKIQMLSISVSD